MRLKIGVVDEFTGADSGAVDYKIEFWIYVLELFEAHVFGNLAIGFQKSVCQMVEVNRRIHQRNGDGKAAGKFTGFDSLTSGPCRGFSSRPILDFARDDTRPERNRPIWNLKFSNARKLAQLDHGNAALGITSKIDKRLVGLERPGNGFVRRLHIVREPERPSDC